MSTREKGEVMFHKRKGPDEPFAHAPDCKIVRADPGVRIPWSEIRRGVWEARCVCGVQYHHDHTVDDRVRLDPLKTGHRGAPHANSTVRPTPPCSGSP